MQVEMHRHKKKKKEKDRGRKKERGGRSPSKLLACAATEATRAELWGAEARDSGTGRWTRAVI